MCWALAGSTILFAFSVFPDALGESVCCGGQALLSRCRVLAQRYAEAKQCIGLVGPLVAACLFDQGSRTPYHVSGDCSSWSPGPARWHLGCFVGSWPPSLASAGSDCKGPTAAAHLCKSYRENLFGWPLAWSCNTLLLRSRRELSLSPSFRLVAEQASMSRAFRSHRGSVQGGARMRSGEDGALCCAMHAVQRRRSY